MSTTDREHIIELVHHLQARADKLCQRTGHTDAHRLYEDLLKLESELLEYS